MPKIKWITTLVAICVGTLSADLVLAGVSRTTWHLSPPSSFSSPWVGQKYLDISDQEIKRSLQIHTHTLGVLEKRREGIVQHISQIKETLHQYLGHRYRDVEAQKKHWDRIDRILVLLHKKPQPWKVAPQIFRRAQDQQMNKSLYKQWDDLEIQMKELNGQIDETRKEIFRLEATLEFQEVYAILVERHSWNNRLGDLRQRIIQYISGLQLDKRQRVVDFSQHKWIGRERKIHKEMDMVGGTIDDMQNVARAVLGFLEGDELLLSRVDRQAVMRFYQQGQKRVGFGLQLCRKLEHYQTHGSPIGVDGSFEFGVDFSMHWIAFLEECVRRGIAIESKGDSAFHLRWQTMPERVFQMQIVPAAALPSLGRTDVRKGLIQMSLAAFASGILAIETLQQELDTFKVKEEEVVATLVVRILNSLERISLLDEGPRERLMAQLDPENKNGIDTLGFHDLIGHYQAYGVDWDLIETILGYIEKASSIYPIESHILRQSWQVEWAA